MNQSQPSLCIPRMPFGNIDVEFIRKVLLKLNFGKIQCINIVDRKNEKGESFKRAYIHFEKWYVNDYVDPIREKLVSGKEIKIVYDNPWFWKISANKSSWKKV
uniref:RRM domain-containing protein n=1 Tax=viral metagenome TaxID=1070528 RepID=A0A6C0KPQ0_9ZZZZ